MQWAHPRTSAAPLKEVMGPGEVGVSSSCKYNGPIWRLRLHLAEKYWTQATLAAGSAINAVGPSTDIGSTFQKSNGPRRSQRQQWLQIRWAHPAASAALLR